MGLFSSKKVTTVGTSISRVVQDDLITSARKAGVVNAIFRDEDLVENVLESLISCIGVKAERMYAFGRDRYIYGLPKSQVLSSHSGGDVVRGVIERVLGHPVEVSYYHFGPINNLHVGWTQLVESHGYDAATNRLNVLSAQKGTPVLLKDMVVVVAEATLSELSSGELAQWGTPANAGLNFSSGELSLWLGQVKAITPTPFEVDPLSPQDYVRVSYIWQETGANGRPSTQESSFNIPFTGFDEEADYFQVRYTFGDQAGYFSYMAGAGTYPELDQIHSPQYSEMGSFFPFGYFRYNKTSASTDTASEEYKSSKRLLKYLGMDFQSLVESIETNPDIEDVEQAMLMMAVPANTTSPIEQRYLFDFFKQAYFSTGAIGNRKSEQSFGILSLLNSTIPKTSIVIQDARFKMALSFTGIFHKTVAGNIGTVGTYSSGFSTEQIIKVGTNTETGEAYEWSSPATLHYYRHQITEALYEEYQVFGLKMTYHIWGKYTAIGDENATILMVPLDHAITKEYSISDRELLYTRSLHYVFNSRVITKLSWYQQEWFQVLIIVAAVVYTVFTLGADGGTGLAAAIAAMTATEVMIAIAIGVLKYLVIQVAFKLFVKVVGAEFAMLVAVVAAAYGVYSAVNAGSIAGAPWAKELLNISSGLTKAVGDSMTEALLDLGKEADAFGLYTEEKTELLDEANSLLKNDSLLNPLILFGESPSEFYQRTVHSGNIGVMGINAISSYVDIALTLPKLSDSI